MYPICERSFKLTSYVSRFENLIPSFMKFWETQPSRAPRSVLQGQDHLSTKSTHMFIETFLIWKTVWFCTLIAIHTGNSLDWLDQSAAGSFMRWSRAKFYTHDWPHQSRDVEPAASMDGRFLACFKKKNLQPLHLLNWLFQNLLHRVAGRMCFFLTNIHFQVCY